MKPDPTIDEVRRVRRMISAEYGNDPQRILEYFSEIQARVKHRLINYGETALPGGPLKNPAEVAGG